MSDGYAADMPPVACPDHDILQRLLSGELEGEEMSRVQDHLDGCAECDRVVVQLVERTRREGAGPTSLGATRPAHGNVGGSDTVGVGDVVGEYELVEALGRGAMGEVYRARDAILGRDVALKVIRQAAALPSDAVARFLREAKAVARFNHPNIVSIYSAGRHRGMPFVALELVRGDTLDDHLTGDEVTEREISRLTTGIARALAEAHRHGVIHRDLKPANVMVGDDGRVRVLDFGLAMMVPVEESGPLSGSSVGRALAAEATSVSGTPRYMAPEQWRRGKITGATDIWALGVILYQMWVGQPPFPATGLQELEEAVTGSAQPPLLSRIPVRWKALVADCLQRDPAARPSAKELLRRLEALGGSARHDPRALAAAAPALGSASPVPVNARPVLLALAAAGALAVGAFTLRDRAADQGLRAPQPPASATTADDSPTASAATSATAPRTLGDAWAALGAGRHEDAARLADRKLVALDAVAGRRPRGATPNLDGATAQRVLTRVALARARAEPERAEEFLTEAKLACERAGSWSSEGESRCCKTDLAAYLAERDLRAEALAELGTTDFGKASCATVVAGLHADDEGRASPPAVGPPVAARFDGSRASRAVQALVPRAKQKCAKLTGARSMSFTVTFLAHGGAKVRGSGAGQTAACVRGVLGQVRVAPFTGPATPIPVTVSME